MDSHGIITLYSTKTLEYIVAISYLFLFVGFWRFVNREPSAAGAADRVAVPQRPHVPPALAGAEFVAEWFRLARDIAYHRGHAWAAPAGDGLVAVGVDDFAQKIVGPLKAVELPAVGTEVRQGEKAWRLRVNGKGVDMLSPVDGIVTEVNPTVLEGPAVIASDPYATGWLFKVRAPRFEANRKGLLSGRLAERWLEQETDALRLRLAPDLGPLMQDGGLPVDGLAHAIDPEHWDDVAREFLLS